MPYTILIEHTIRIVHPTVSWGMVIDWTELLTVLSIKCISCFNFFPTNKVINQTNAMFISCKLDIKQHITTILTDIKWNIIISLVNSKFTIELFHDLIIFDNTNMCITFFLLYWKKNILICCLHTFYCVI